MKDHENKHRSFQQLPFYQARLFCQQFLYKIVQLGIQSDRQLISKSLNIVILGKPGLKIFRYLYLAPSLVISFCCLKINCSSIGAVFTIKTQENFVQCFVNQCHLWRRISTKKFKPQPKKGERNTNSLLLSSTSTNIPLVLALF